MEFIILFLIIYTNSIFISNLLKKKVEQVIPISVVGMALVIYIFGLFQRLDIGVKFLELLSILATAYNVIYLINLIKKKKIKPAMKRIITPGLLVYIGLYFIFIMINKGRVFESYDEFTHWAVIVKNMYMYNGYRNS